MLHVCGTQPLCDQLLAEREASGIKPEGMLQRIKEYEAQFDPATKAQLRAVLPEHLPSSHIVAAAGAVTAAPSSDEDDSSDESEEESEEEAKAREEAELKAKQLEEERLRKVCIPVGPEGVASSQKARRVL